MVNRSLFPVILLLLSSTGVIQAHPLDPLSKAEIARVAPLLRQLGRVDDSSRFPLITLFSPPKSEVLSWKEGQSYSRRALAVVKQGSRTFEAIVDLRSSGLESWKEVSGAQPMLLEEELFGVAEIVQADPRWRQAMQRRGFESFETVICMPLSAGYLGDSSETGKRLVRVPCFDGREGRNFWAHPIEGLTAVVDLNQKSVLRVHDNGNAPVPHNGTEYGREDVGPQRQVNRVSPSQPAGAGYQLKGQEVEWQGWSFHFRFDARVGPVLSSVRHKDGEQWRSVLYEGHLSEIFVPYMDPAVGWSFRTYMDAGEYGAGKLMSPLEVGNDCPDYSSFFGAVMSDDKGQPLERENALCLFERDPVDPSWRHYDFVGGTTETRRSQELVLRFIPAIGNYDYIFDWIFRQDGSIRVRVGATGIVEVKGVAATDSLNDPSGSADQYGRFIDRNTVAVNHDHFINFRLDFDVDGPSNSFVIDRMRTRKVESSSGRKSVWAVQSEIARTESDAQLVLNLERPALWRVIHPGKRGVGGYPVSYQIAVGHNAISLLDPSDWPQIRASFTKYHLWVTPYSPAQRYAGGDYPYQNQRAAGLPEWTRANRQIENTDIVLWYTVGFHHVVRPEDWPVMPTAWHEFELKPFGFFKRNPAMNLP